MELRCESKLHGIIISDGVIEVKCGSQFCGASPGVVVLHRFSTSDGSLIETKLYKDTPNIKKEARNALGQRAAVRSA